MDQGSEGLKLDAPGLLRRVFGATVKVWMLLATLLAAVLAAAVFWMFAGSSDHEAKRWKTAGPVIEKPGFARLLRSETPKTNATTNAGTATAAASDGPIPTGDVDWAQPHVAVYSVPSPPSQPVQAAANDHAGDGQAHATDGSGQNVAGAGQPEASRPQAPINTNGSSSSNKDPLLFGRVLVSTVTKGAEWDPGDRMIWTRVFVQPINFEFAGYTVAATENETVKVTTVEATNTRKFSADIGLTIPGLEGPKASLGPSDERSVKTTGDITAQYEKLGIDIMPNFLRIIRESETGGDVVGNTTVSLSMVTDQRLIWRKFPRDGSEAPANDDVVLLVSSAHLTDGYVDLKPGEAAITALPQNPVPHCALRARVWMLYEQRHIDGGREYYDEAKQKVILQRDADEQKDVEIVRADDVSPAVWSIKILPNRQKAQTGNEETRYLSAHAADGGEFRKLVFTDYAQASKLAHWVRVHPNATVQNLVFNNEDGESVIPVKTAGDECYHEQLSR